MPRIEYITKMFDYNSQTHLSKLLNEMGDEGWKLSAVENGVYIFLRKKV